MFKEVHPKSDNELNAFETKFPTVNIAIGNNN